MIDELKTEYIEKFSRIKREGASELLDWLEERTDFFTAPASTRFHGSYEGGLVKHSLNVYDRLRTMAHGIYQSETIAIVSLLHDICKVNFYKQEMRNVKENGIWKQKPYYTVVNQFPYGHGEASVYLIERFMKLTIEEAMAIRWHMGAFDNAVKGGDYSLGEAMNKYPLVVLTHCADLQATYLDEGGIK